MSFEILFLILITGHSGTTVIVLAHIRPSAELAVFALVAIAGGFLAFLLVRRSPLVGVVTGEALLVAGALLFGS